MNRWGILVQAFWRFRGYRRGASRLELGALNVTLLDATEDKPLPSLLKAHELEPLELI